MSVTMDRASVSVPSDQAVRVSRRFKAPRTLVYEAFTKPELVRRWLLGPPGWTMPVCEMDLRVGGTFRWRWRSEENGSEFGFHGVFRLIDAPAKIVHTEAYEPGDLGGSMGAAGESLVTVTFTERDGVTTVTSLIDFGSKEARDAAVATGMTDGMEQSYQLLDALLAEGVA